MLKDRLTSALFALLVAAMVVGGVMLSSGVPQVAAAPRPVLTASAEPPTQTPPPTATSPGAPTATATPPGAPPPTATPPGQPTDVPPTVPTDSPPADDSSEQIADAAVAKEANRNEAALGDEISFSITVTNVGNALAQGVIVEDTLPSYLALVSASVDKGQAVVNGNTAGLWIGDVAPGEVVRGEITARVVAIPESLEGSNGVVLSSVNASDRPENNFASVPIRFIAPEPSPTPSQAPAPSPTPTPVPVAARPPHVPQDLPTTAGSTSLPVGLLLLLFMVGAGSIAAGLSFWLPSRRRQK